MEASICRNDEVTIIGGGNSVGQVAVLLTGFVRPLYLLIRRLSATRIKQQH
jgi:thioredoxin reductase (NADPH)